MHECARPCCIRSLLAVTWQRHGIFQKHFQCPPARLYQGHLAALGTTQHKCRVCMFLCQLLPCLKPPATSGKRRTAFQYTSGVPKLICPRFCSSLLKNNPKHSKQLACSPCRRLARMSLTSTKPTSCEGESNGSSGRHTCPGDR